MSDRYLWDRDERTLYIGPFDWPFRWTAYITLPRFGFYRKRVHPTQAIRDKHFVAEVGVSYAVTYGGSADDSQVGPTPLT